MSTLITNMLIKFTLLKTRYLKTHARYIQDVPTKTKKQTTQKTRKQGTKETKKQRSENTR